MYVSLILNHLCSEAGAAGKQGDLNEINRYFIQF